MNLWEVSDEKVLLDLLRQEVKDFMVVRADDTRAVREQAVAPNLKAVAE